jgi:hypothetical protein
MDPQTVLDDLVRALYAGWDGAGGVPFITRDTKIALRKVIVQHKLTDYYKAKLAPASAPSEAADDSDSEGESEAPNGGPDDDGGAP